VATLSADLRPLAGVETIEADRLAGSVSHEVALRYRPGVVPAMRFRPASPWLWPIFRARLPALKDKLRKLADQASNRPATLV
jgi:hypothetical protein